MRIQASEIGTSAGEAIMMPNRKKCYMCNYVFGEHEIRWTSPLMETLCNSCHTEYVSSPLNEEERQRRKYPIWIEAKCKMSIFIEEYDEESNYCGISTLVKCEGKQEDRRNCPYWKHGAGEP